MEIERDVLVAALRAIAHDIDTSVVQQWAQRPGQMRTTALDDNAWGRHVTNVLFFMKEFDIEEREYYYLALQNEIWNQLPPAESRENDLAVGAYWSHIHGERVAVDFDYGGKTYRIIVYGPHLDGRNANTALVLGRIFGDTQITEALQELANLRNEVVYAKWNKNDVEPFLVYPAK